MKGKKFLKRTGIVIGVLALIIGAVFIIFHDNTDTAKIAKEQKAKAEKESVEMMDDLNDSF